MSCGVKKASVETISTMLWKEEMNIQFLAFIITYKRIYYLGRMRIPNLLAAFRRLLSLVARGRLDLRANSK